MKNSYVITKLQSSDAVLSQSTLLLIGNTYIDKKKSLREAPTDLSFWIDVLEGETFKAVVGLFFSSPIILTSSLGKQCSDSFLS